MEKNETQHQAVATVGNYSEKLYAKKIYFSCVEQSLVHVENTHGKYRPDTAEAMNQRIIKRIINLKPLEDFPQTLKVHGSYHAY